MRRAPYSLHEAAATLLPQSTYPHPQRPLVPSRRIGNGPRIFADQSLEDAKSQLVGAHGSRTKCSNPLGWGPGPRLPTELAARLRPASRLLKSLDECAFGEEASKPS